MDELDKLLIGEAEEIKVKDNYGFDQLHISSYAYQKAFSYARLVMDKRPGSVEIGGFLTQPRDSKDRVVRDAFLARDQRVSRYEYMLDADSVLKAKKELDERGERILGWWHSHGRFDTFHSKIDDENQQTILRQIAPSNYVVVSKEKDLKDLQSVVDGDDLVLWDSYEPSTKFRIKLKDENPNSVIKNMRIISDKRIGFAYSFVVNHHRWIDKRVPYCEIGTREVCHDCSSVSSNSKRVEFKLFEDNDQRIIDDSVLLKEIEDRVNVNGEKGRSYFLPSVFKDKRDSGTLTEPEFNHPTEQVDGKAPDFYPRKEKPSGKGEWPGGLFGNLLNFGGGEDDGNPLR